MIILGSGTQQALLHEEVDLALESMQSARYCVTGYELDVKSVEYLVRKPECWGFKQFESVASTKPKARLLGLRGYFSPQ